MPREWRVLGFELKWNRDLGHVSLHLPKLIDGNFATEKRNFQFPSLAAASERQSISEGNVAFVLFNILPRELEFQSSRNVMKWVTLHERLWAEPQGVYDNDFSSFRVDVVINDNLIFMISWDRNLTARQAFCSTLDFNEISCSFTLHWFPTLTYPSLVWKSQQASCDCDSYLYVDRTFNLIIIKAIDTIIISEGWKADRKHSPNTSADN